MDYYDFPSKLYPFFVYFLFEISILLKPSRIN